MIFYIERMFSIMKNKRTLHVVGSGNQLQKWLRISIS